MYSLRRLHHRHTRALYGHCRLGGVQCSAVTPATTTSADASNVRSYIGDGFRHYYPSRSSQEVGHSFTSESNHGNNWRWMSSSGSRSVALGHQPNTNSISISAHHHSHSASQSQATVRHRSSSKSFTKNKSKRAYAKHYERGPDMRNCQSIEEIAQLASDSLDNMSPRDLAAFWTLTSKFLQNNTTTNNNNNRNPGRSSRQGGATGVMVKQLHDRDQQSMQIAVLTRQLQSVLVRTMDRVNRFRPRDLAQTALGLARIVNAVSGNEKRRQRGAGNATTASSSSSHYQILHGLLIGKEEDPSSLTSSLSSSTSNRKDMFFQSIANASMKFLHTFEGQYLCNLAYANAIANTLPSFPHHDGSNLFENIARHSIPLLDNASEFQPQTFSNMVWAFDKLGVIHPELFEEVEKTIVGMDSLDEFKPQELSNTLLAFANTTIDTSNNEGGDGESQQHYAALFDTVAEHIVQLDNLDWFKPQEFSNIVWAYAVADKSHPMLFQKIADHILDPDYNLKRFKPKDLCSTVWAFAKTQQSHPMLFETVAHEILALGGNRLWYCDPPQLSMIVWAYAKDCEGQHWHQQPYHAEIFTKVAEHMMIRLDKLESGFMISNILWAFTKTLSGEQKQEQGTVNNRLFDKMAKYILALDNVGEETFSNPYSLSTTLWAFAKSGSSNSKLFEKAEKHILALDSLEGLNGQDLSNIAWAFSTAKGRPKSQRLLNKIADQVVSLLGSSSNSFEPQALSNLMWAYANANIFHPRLLDAIANEVIARHSEFNSQEASNLLWAYSSLGKLDPGLFESLESTVVECLDKCNSQELANIAWAYSVANADASTLFCDESLFVDICNQKVEEFTFEELGQLHQWNLWRKELQSEISLPSLLETRCYNAFISVTPTHSNLQQQVVSELKSIGLQPQEEVLMKTTGYRIDALVEVNGNTIGVEVDGPSHFIDREPTGNTLLKRREVTNLDDIQLVSVPYWEWNDVKDDDTKKQGYLRSLLGL